jgi:hypothetical protein
VLAKAAKRSDWRIVAAGFDASSAELNELKSQGGKLQLVR